MIEAVKYIGLDVHKETIAVAVADGERGGEIRYFGTVPNEDDAIRKLVKRLTGSGTKLHVCYEAGPCGYGLHRLLTRLGQSCIVIAPSMMPRRPGDHVKTDRRGAMDGSDWCASRRTLWISCVCRQPAKWPPPASNRQVGARSKKIPGPRSALQERGLTIN